MSKSKKSIELEKLISRLSEKEQNLKNKINRLSYYRLLMFLSGICCILLAFFFINDTITIITAILSIIIFSILINFHNKLVVGNKQLEKWIDIKKTHLAKTNVDWKNIPNFDLPSDVKTTPIEADLNLIGRNSLLQLISFAFTLQGKLKLRDLFIEQTLDKHVIEKKQNLVRELIALSNFREKLFLKIRLSFGVENFNSKLSELINKSEPKKYLNVFYSGLTIFAIINISLIVLNMFSVLPNYWTITSASYLLLYYLGYRYIKNIHSTADTIYEDIRKFSPIFKYIYNKNFDSSPNLTELLKPLLDKKQSPKNYIDKIKLTLDLLELQKNPMIWFMIIFLFPVDYFIASKLEKFKQSIVEHFPKWLESFYQLEAFSSLANFAVLNEEYTFPKISENDKLTFSSDSIGHPLISKEEQIKNSFEIKSRGEINIITGSNMSGKSTFLRTIGINTVLAYSGSVVDAKNMTLSLFDLFTCIKVSDSVTDGISYFYAEVKRLKELISKLENNKHCVLYLIDEIYKGTNNTERLNGSEALLKHLSPLNTVGIISTHDLELVNMEKVIPNIKNYHFKEIIKDNEMSFDYNFQKGPCPTTNALKIMELEGLPVQI